MTTSESFEAIHHALMGSENELDFVVVQELLDSVWPELDYVACSIGVSDEVGLNTEFLVIISGVAPQYVDHQLLFRSRHFMDDFQGSLDHFNLLETDQSASYSTMETHYSFFDDCS